MNIHLSAVFAVGLAMAILVGCTGADGGSSPPATQETQSPADDRASPNNVEGTPNNPNFPVGENFVNIEDGWQLSGVGSPGDPISHRSHIVFTNPTEHREDSGEIPDFTLVSNGAGVSLLEADGDRSDYRLNLEFIGNQNNDGYQVSAGYAGHGSQPITLGGLFQNDNFSQFVRFGGFGNENGHALAVIMTQDYGVITSTAEAEIVIDFWQQNAILALYRFRDSMIDPTGIDNNLSDHEIGFDTIIVDNIGVNGSALSGGTAGMRLQGTPVDMSTLFGENIETSLNAAMGMTEVVGPGSSPNFHANHGPFLDNTNTSIRAHIGGAMAITGNKGTFSSSFFTRQ